LYSTLHIVRDSNCSPTPRHSTRHITEHFWRSNLQFSPDTTLPNYNTHLYSPYQLSSLYHRHRLDLLQYRSIFVDTYQNHLKARAPVSRSQHPRLDILGISSSYDINTLAPTTVDFNIHSWRIIQDGFASWSKPGNSGFLRSGIYSSSCIQRSASF